MTPGPVVAGVGMHPFGRFPDKSLRDLARTAIVHALDDAGSGVKDVGGVFSANSLAGVLQGQEQIRGQIVLRDVGIERVPVVNVENACASGSTAFAQAVQAVRSGSMSVALAIGFEKMYVEDRTRSLNALQSAADVDLVGELGLQFTAIYAMRIRKRMAAGELSWQHLLDVSVKSHHNGSLNPFAQHRKRFSASDIASSRSIAEPLTLLMCSSICDGAAAAVVVRGDHELARRQPRVFVRASAMASGYARSQVSDPPTPELCARAAYEQAGVGPDDLNVIEVHDAMAPAELMYYDMLGLCQEGGAGDLLASGATEIDGRIPVNPSGGLCSRGHPVGATGLAQIAELVWQLRGQAGPRQVRQPRIALAQNSGGWVEGEPAAVAVHILERQDAWD